MTTLRSSEWALVGGLLLLLISLLLIAQINAHRVASPLSENLPAHELCSVTIDGAVKKPGTYRIPPGTPLKKVLVKAKPLRFADLHNLSPSSRVEEDLNLHIPLLTELTIHLEGALPEPLDLKVAPRTRVSDLPSKIALLPSSDRAFFKSRRMLKDGETLTIPEASSPQKKPISPQRKKRG